MTTSELLARLGVTANYKGFFYIASSVELCLEDHECLHLVTKCVYPEVAKRYGTNWKAVERDIRKAVELIWAQHREALERLARSPLPRKPGNAQFLAILTLAAGEATLPEASLLHQPFV